MSIPSRFETLYESDDLVTYANHLLEECGSKLRVTGVKQMGDRFVHFAAVGTRGDAVEIVAPMGEYRPGLLFFRSLLRVGNPDTAANWLVNGQSGTNTRELVHYGETGPALASTLDRLEGYYDGLRVTMKDESRRRAARLAEEYMAEACKQGILGDEVQVVRFGGESTERTPLRRESDAAPGPRV